MSPHRDARSMCASRGKACVCVGRARRATEGSALGGMGRVPVASSVGARRRHSVKANSSSGHLVRPAPMRTCINTLSPSVDDQIHHWPPPPPPPPPG
mmetsp:Transcript_72448/g.198506  ORF Transcript_72448/g.198506 Transcript_72448/m.198506 type:complete len:97 (-) Transcript_72448:9-299(-)